MTAGVSGFSNGRFAGFRLATSAPQPLTDPDFGAIARWFEAQPAYGDQSQIVMCSPAAVNVGTLVNVRAAFDVGEGWQFAEQAAYACDIFPQIHLYTDEIPSYCTGARRFVFLHEDGAMAEVLVIAVFYSDGDNSTAIRSLALVPLTLVMPWLAFDKELRRLENSAMNYRGKVYVVGGTENSFDTAVKLDDVYLPAALKEEVLFDIQAFFERGVAIYQRLNIKPFRKLLLAGVPGTGKTMFCSAIANWAIEQGMFVVYVSGSSNGYGARFWKVHQALDMAASSESRTIVIVEELDAFMSDDESKAELLNVLDGMESPNNTLGTILISTTNHPEKIDDRVLKRPGRLDRVFIVPEMEDRESTEHMLRNYLGDKWQDEHREFVAQLLGKPGAVIREVALYALTRAAYRQEEGVSIALLQQSLDLLTQQIEAKDDFLTAHRHEEFGFATSERKNRRKRTLMDL